MATAHIEPWRYASVGDSRREYDEYGEAIGDWLGCLAEWQWFVTCTLRDPPSRSGFTLAGAGTARSCLRSLLERTLAKQFVCVFELQDRGAYHLHALLAGCPSINGEVAAKWFEEHFGFSRWKIFSEGGQAPKYIGKYLTKDVVELYIGSQGPYVLEDFKRYTGGFTRKGKPRWSWDTTMKGTRV